MYIKNIKAQGFKSFADKVEIDFEKTISAIVGPNGSGKSNVVDAILWVLGEQSVKTLRGDGNMTDVIFSGSGSREPLKKASVSILFDNTDHALNTDLTEVEIKRIVYSSGENEYFINNAHVRLKDITELLMDVTSKFNIITQGNIASLVDNKSSERRTLFESAAGVLKYRKRKEESLKKLSDTKENLTRVSLVINELNNTLEPLEKQKNDAEKYLEVKKELENVEISLIASDVTNFNKEYDKLKLENENMQKSLDKMTITHPIELEKLKLELVKLDEEINDTNKNIIGITEDISNLNSQKQINIERSKFSENKEEINNDLINLNENKLKLQNNIEILKLQIKDNTDKLSEIVKNYNNNSDKSLKLRVDITNLNNDINNLNKNILILKNKINIEKENMDNNAFMPKSVNYVINSKELKGICNTIGNLIDIPLEYDLAINTSLGASSNFIITKKTQDAKDAINYLKRNNMGRATFFPLDTIKSRYIEDLDLKDINGFIGIASDLIKYDKEYKSVMENQLGNVIIAKDLDSMTDIAKKTNNKYKIVSLEGDISYPGGSLSGGTINNKLSSKNSFNALNKELDEDNIKLKYLNEELDNKNKEYDKLNEIIQNNKEEITTNKLIIENKNINLSELENNYKEICDNISSLDTLKDNKVESLISNLINEISSKEKQKNIFENDLKKYQSRKFEVSNQIDEIENDIKKQNSEYHKLENNIKENEIEIAKYEIKIDNLLKTIASDYNMTYEYALNNYSLEMDETLARNIVNKDRNILKRLDNVNIGSIEEYARLKERYDFLNNQKIDLETSSNELLKIIDEMDNIMKEKFKDTFDKISLEFSKVFRIMFKGGNGVLKLSDENDLLNCGINILAVPPGKKLNSTSSLSGGEKTLTAICMIFAILNVRPVPFIILDEAEAALDEENVNMFGDYLNGMKNSSQFILITHKKKMMEYADCLYGITMQESGVSKLVSVKLEDK